MRGAIGLGLVRSRLEACLAWGLPSGFLSGVVDLPWDLVLTGALFVTAIVRFGDTDGRVCLRGAIPGTMHGPPDLKQRHL